MESVVFNTLSSKVFHYLDSLNREIAYTMKPKTLKMVPMFADIDTKTLSTYIRRWKKKKPAYQTSQCVVKPQKTTRVTAKVTEFEDDDDSEESSSYANRVFNNELARPDTLPVTITTEWMEKETLQQYYNSDEPKDKQKYLDILHKIWSIKNKVPSENTAKNDSMEDLFVRLSQTE